jgi:uncharacterized protein YlxW (UPF0749 family)
MSKVTAEDLRRCGVVQRIEALEVKVGAIEVLLNPSITEVQKANKERDEYRELAHKLDKEVERLSKACEELAQVISVGVLDIPVFREWFNNMVADRKGLALKYQNELEKAKVDKEEINAAWQQDYKRLMARINRLEARNKQLSGALDRMVVGKFEDGSPIKDFGAFACAAMLSSEQSD